MGKRYIILFSVLLVAILHLQLFSANAQATVNIELNYGDKKFTYRDSYIEPSNHVVAEEIYERRINAPYEEKIELISDKLKYGATYKTALLICFPLLEATVDRAISVINADPIDSKIDFDPSVRPMFTITRERVGTKVLEDRLYMDIYFALMSAPSIKVKIPVEHPTPKVTINDNIPLTNLRAKYSTDFSSSTEDRKHNISLALSKLNGKVIMGGETLSFNDTVGKRTAKNGFKEAKIIKGGKYVPGVGGGVCQVSTTLYNAALMSDLKISAVNRHSLQSSYELPSFDAMVNSGSSDLKILNQGEKPVFVKAYDDGQRAYVEIYGSKLPYKIKRKSEVTFTGETPGYDEVVDLKFEHFDEGTESGARKIISYSHPEVHSNGYLLYYDLYGNLLEKKLIRSDVYGSVKGLIAIAP